MFTGCSLNGATCSLFLQVKAEELAEVLVDGTMKISPGVEPLNVH
jgi:hypothetical protein